MVSYNVGPCDKNVFYTFTRRVLTSLKLRLYSTQPLVNFIIYIYIYIYRKCNPSYSNSNGLYQSSNCEEVVF